MCVCFNLAEREREGERERERESERDVDKVDKMLLSFKKFLETIGNKNIVKPTPNKP